MNKTQKIIFAVLACILAAAIAVAAVLVWRLHTPVRGEFIPPEFDLHAVEGLPTVPEGSMQYAQLDVASGFQIALCGNARLQDGRLYLYFTSLAENAVWMKLRVLDEAGNVLGESGLVRPGEYLSSVALTLMPQQGNTLTVKVISYEPETYYSKGVAPITIGFTAGE